MSLVPASGNPVSSFSLAHLTLLRAQRMQGGYLSIEQARRRLRVTPGIVFAPGTTLDDVINGLQYFMLIHRNGNQIQVLE